MYVIYFYLEKTVSEFDIITSILKEYNKFVRPIDPVVKVTHSLIPKEMVKFVSVDEDAFLMYFLFIIFFFDISC